jgi:glycosyltransferase involved in cell wall biosynthesis
LELLDRGHEVTVFALDPAVDSAHRYTHGRLTLSIAPYRPRARERVRDLFRAERRHLADAMRAERCDVLHAHWTYEFALAALSPDVQSHVVVTAHDWAPTILRYCHDPYRAVRLLMQGAVLARAPRLTAPSPHIASRLARFTRAPVTVVPNGLPDSFFRPRAAPSSGAPQVIGAINNGHTRLKNVDALLRAFHMIKPSLPAAHLHLAGLGFHPDGPCARQAAEAGLSDRVVFHGPLSQPEVGAFLQQCDVFVHPALEESFGMVVVEAMAAGVPVVVGRRSGALPWVVSSAAPLVNVRSPGHIAAAIEVLLRDKGRWARSSKSAFDTARTRFSLAPVVDGYEAVYRAAQATP